MGYEAKPIVSLWLGKENKGKPLGSGVCIAKDWVLTVKHVIGEHKAEEIWAGLIPDVGNGLRCKAIYHHTHPDQGVYQRDIALLHLSSAHQKKVLDCHFDFTPEPGDKVFIQGFNVAENAPTEALEKPLKNWTDPGGWEFDTWPAQGMSGGAAIFAGKLVGIVQAQDRTQNSGIMIPLGEVREFIEQHLGPQEDKLSAQPSRADWQALDEQFMQSVRNGIEQNLKLSPSLMEKLGARYDKADAQLLTTALIDQCRHGHFSRVVQKMQGAFKEAWAGLNTDSMNERNDLLEASDLVASHLVLYNVKDEWLAANHAHYSADNEHVLPKLKLESANVALSRLLGGVPSYKRGVTDQKTMSIAKGVGTAIEFLESGIGKEKAVRSVLELLVAVLKPDEITCLPSDQDELEDLAEEINEELSFYRDHEELNMRKRHFIMLPKRMQLDEAVYTELRRLLPDMAWVVVDVNGSKDVFVISDVKLKTAIEAFFKTLEGVSPT